MNILIMSLLFVIMSCGQDRTGLDFQVTERENTGLEGEVLVVTFATLKNKILETQCIKCHASIASEDVLLKWVKPGRPEESSLFRATETGRMPKNAPPLSTADLELIRGYINSLKQEVIRPETKPKERIVSFTEVKNKILVPSCIGCHDSMKEEEHLMDWIDKKNPINSKIYQNVKNGNMPMGGPPLDEAEVKLVLSYIQSLVGKE